ncbi:LysR substrate-binding domain-containing protein [Mesorhizobium sp. INR15]|uniref:LysR substrate-binding domain-containing protein n=1 Tax=Mesorhizobium sp. INR15 TaxID=2654248 RepID=UPI001896970E|nr:LysR substrate-binding domain-containing protein [Mesorhizobium sp. INR15]QPC95484.1 LysR family transcriptional regulator [Mesorhizobium sp. INR15]
MVKSLRKLPQPRALVVFESAGRLLNFTSAGREVGMSQAGVSKQIQFLEAALGVRLFQRSNRGLLLTSAGRRLYAAVTFGLNHILDAVEEVRQHSQPGRISVTTTIALASVWLMPRIAKFRAAYPDIDLKLIATDSLLDLPSERIDIAIRYGMGQWQGTKCQKLFGIELFPVCSPAYLARYSNLMTSDDLRSAALLHLDEPNSQDADWAVWFKAVGIVEPTRAAGLHFNNYPLLIQAAVDGQGVALGWGHLIDDLLDNMSLVRCMSTSLTLKPAFFVVRSVDGAPQPEATLFEDWIVAETRTLAPFDPSGI